MVPIILLVALAPVALSAENLDLNFDYYCSDELKCQGALGTDPNTLCNATLKYGPSCVGAKYIPMTDELKELFLDTHNRLRNEMALGKAGHLFENKTIADMAAMSWDDELELSSLSNTLRCKMEHDACRDTAKYKTVGQNLAMYFRSPLLKLSVIDHMKELMKDWYDEYRLVKNLDEVNSLGSSGSSGIYHWAQFVQSKADRIGCSAVRMSEPHGVLFGCNYNVGNVGGFPIFTFGEPASLCKSGRHLQYEGLCHPSEDVSQRKNGNIYFKSDAPESPVVKQWLKNGKKLNL